MEVLVQYSSMNSFLILNEKLSNLTEEEKLNNEKKEIQDKYLKQLLKRLLSVVAEPIFQASIL